MEGLRKKKERRKNWGPRGKKKSIVRECYTSGRWKRIKVSWATEARVRKCENYLGKGPEALLLVCKQILVFLPRFFLRVADL